MTGLLFRQRWLWVGALAVQLLWAQPAPAQTEVSATRKAFDDAEGLFQEGKMPEALRAFQEFENKFKFSGLIPQAISYQGWCQYNLGKHKDAIATFNRVLKTYPNNPVVPGALLKLAESYRELKDVPNALATYKRVQREFADPPHELLPQAYLGEAWLLYKDWQTNNTKEKPADPKLLDTPKKIADMVARRFASNLGVRLDALFLLAQIFSDQGNYEEARKIYEQIRSMRNNPRAAEALFLAGETMYDAGRALQDQNRPEDATRRYKDAISYYQRVASKATLLRGIDDEIAEIRRLIPQQLENRDALNARIASLVRLKQQINTQQDLRAIALFRTGNAYQYIGYAEESVVVYQHFLRLFPADRLAPQTLFALSQSLTQAGRAKEAEAALAELKAKHPEYKDLDRFADFLIPKNQFDTGQYQAALAGFEKFIAGTKEADLKETAEFYRAACYVGLERFESARDAFAKFLKDHPTSGLAADATFRLGRTHFELSQRRTDDPPARAGDLREAIKYYEQVRTQKTRNDLLPDVTFQLGYLYSYLSEFDTNQVERAVTAFTDYVANWPDQPLACEAMFQTAGLLVKLNKPADAISQFQKVLDKCPQTDFAPPAAFEIGRVHALGKQDDEMIAALRAYVEKYPTHGRVGDALFAIAQSLENRNKSAEASAAYQELIATAARAGQTHDNLLNSAVGAQLRWSALLEREGKLPEAVARCEDFIKQFQWSNSAIRAVVPEIARLYTAAKDVPGGVARLSALATTYAHVDEIRILAGTTILEVVLEKKDYQAAYGQALKLLADPKAAALPGATYNAIGKTFLKRNAAAEARPQFDKALAQSPDDPRVVGPALAGLMECYFILKQPAEAETAVTRLLKEFPQTPSLHGAYAASYDAKLIQGKLAEAKGDFKTAVDLFNEVMQKAKGDAAGDAALRSGNFFLHKQNDPKTALPYFLRVTFLTGGALAEEASFRVGECQEQLYKSLPAGTDREKAIKNQAHKAAINSYKSYVNRYPDARFAPDARKRLSELESVQ